jgi:uncharacterized membrane protein
MADSAGMIDSPGMADSTARGDSPFRRWLTLDRIFVAIAIIIGNALIVIVPPFQAADEAQHFFRAWQITEGQFICRDKTSLGEAGGYLPFSVYAFWMRFEPMAINPDVKTSARAILDTFHMPLDPQNRSLIEFGNTAHYCPTNYLPQCIGIAIGRALGLPLPMILYLGREFNLLVFTLLGCLSLRWAPAIARPMFLLVAIPTMLCLAASVSGDTLTDGLAFVFTALICRLYAAGPNSIHRRQFLLLLLITIPLSVGKIVYVPLLALLLLIPAANFGGMGRKAAMIFLLAVMNLTALVTWTSATSNLDTRITTQNYVSPSLQLQELEKTPGRIPRLFYNTAVTGGWFVVTTYVAVIGWMDLNFPPGDVIIYLLLILLACWAAARNFPLPAPLPAAAVILPAVIVSFIGIGLLNYLYWTAVGAPHIVGLQGRYFFPLTPAVFILFCGLARRLPRLPVADRKIDAALVFLVMLFLVYLLESVWTRFYA